MKKKKITCIMNQLFYTTALLFIGLTISAQIKITCIGASIAENAGMKIVNQFNRPVLNRTEKDKTAYSEIIFNLKEK